jgi:hypothetical protein
MAAYAEFVDTSFRSLVDPNSMAATPELVELGMSIVGVQPESPVHQTRPFASPARGRSRVARMGVAVAAIALCAAILTIWRPWSREVVPGNLRAELSERMREDSQGRLLYSETLLPQRRGTRGAGDSGTVLADLQGILERYDAKSSSSEAAWWIVAGFIALEQDRTADVSLREAIQHHPREAQLYNLAAILDFKRSDLGGAEAQLRKSLELERTSVALVNLAIVLRERGQTSEVRALLEEAAERSPGSELATFAQDLAAEQP